MNHSLQEIIDKRFEIIETESLEAIFDRYGSDKGTILEGHKYAHQYEKLINKNIKTLLEIGIGTDFTYNGTCGSIRGWLEWLPDTKIYGFDIQDAPEDLKNNPRFKCIIGDQGKEEDLFNLKNSIPECDVIIDDGSHINSHQISTFNMLWDKLKVGGYYIIEDVHCKWGDPPYTTDVLAFHPYFYKYIGKNNEGMVFKKVGDCLGNFITDLQDIPESEFTQKLISRSYVLEEIYKACGCKWALGCGSYLFDGLEYKYYSKMYPKQKLLYDLAKKSTNVLEIGTYMGHSLFIMLLANQNLHITCIDIDNTYAGPSIDYLRKEFPYSNIKFINKDSLEALQEINEKFDLFHIDGHHEHSRIKREFELCKKLNNSDTMDVIFDDFEWFKDLESTFLSDNEVITNVTPKCDWSNSYFKFKLS
jgi:cephalosporin hydroxylase